MELTDNIQKPVEAAGSQEAAMDEMIRKFLDGQSEEDIARIRNCQSLEEFIALMKEKGIELSDEQLDAVSGGVNWPDCPSYQPGQNAPIPESLSNNPRIVHLIRSNVTL